MGNDKKTAGLRGRYKITNRTKAPKPELSDEELIRSLEKYASVPTPTKENVGGLLTTPMRGKIAFCVIVNGVKPSFFTKKLGLYRGQMGKLLKLARSENFHSRKGRTRKVIVSTIEPLPLSQKHLRAAAEEVAFAEGVVEEEEEGEGEGEGEGGGGGGGGGEEAAAEGEYYEYDVHTIFDNDHHVLECADDSRKLLASTPVTRSFTIKPAPVVVARTSHRNNNQHICTAANNNNNNNNNNNKQRHHRRASNTTNTNTTAQRKNKKTRGVAALSAARQVIAVGAATFMSLDTHRNPNHNQRNELHHDANTYGYDEDSLYANKVSCRVDLPPPLPSPLPHRGSRFQRLRQEERDEIKQLSSYIGAAMKRHAQIFDLRLRHEDN